MLQNTSLRNDLVLLQQKYELLEDANRKLVKPIKKKVAPHRKPRKGGLDEH